MEKNKKKYLALLIILNFLLLLISLLYRFAFISTGGKIFTCRFYSALGFYCMGCGGSRSLLALLNFNFIKSFILFPAVPTAALLLFIFDLLFAVCFVKNDFSFIKKIGYKPILIIPILLILNFFVKNFFLFLNFDLIAFAEKLTF